MAGGLVGGPIGNRLIRRRGLIRPGSAEKAAPPAREAEAGPRRETAYAPAAFQLITAAGLGTGVSFALSALGLTFPVYMGGMLTAIVMRNLGEGTGRFRIHMEEIHDMSGIFLNLFLGIAMITLKLWQIADLALPLMALLAVQTAWMVLYAYFWGVYLLGHDYEAAVLCAGLCGLGLGATPTAMANMQSVCRRYGPALRAFLIVPVVGGVILDLCNSLLITFFINLF